jgi:chromosomal replication initiation ATPase DnaA
VTGGEEPDLLVKKGDRRINEILQAVAKHYGLSREQLLLERGRLPHRARYVARYLACRVTRCSFPQIGARTGGVTSTNVVFAFRKMEREMERDAQLRSEIDDLKAQLLR